MLNASTLLASCLWGSVGIGCIIYGKKQTEAVPLISGFVLVGISYLIPNALYMSVVGSGILGVMGWMIKSGY